MLAEVREQGLKNYYDGLSLDLCKFHKLIRFVKKTSPEARERVPSVRTYALHVGSLGLISSTTGFPTAPRNNP